VARSNDAMVEVIDVATCLSVGSVPVGKEPQGIGITPDGKFALVSNEDNDNLSVIDIATLKVLPYTIPVNHFPSSIAFTPDGKLALLAYNYTENDAVMFI